MSSALQKLFGGTVGSTGGIGVGRESLANQLLTPENLPTKTRIANPAAFSLLDVIALYLANPDIRNKGLKEAGLPITPTFNRSDIKVGDTLTVFARAMRTNLVSLDGLSRAEFVEVTKQTEFEQDRMQRRLEKMMFGMQD